MSFHEKIVALVNLFFSGVCGVLLVSGAGVPALRLAAGLVFCICLFNLSIYWREFGLWLKKNAAAARWHLAEARRASREKNLARAEAAAAESQSSRRPSSGNRAPRAKPIAEVHKKREKHDDFQDDDFDLDDDDDEFEFEDDDDD